MEENIWKPKKLWKFGLFLGAGASVCVNKPTTKQFKENMVNYSPGSQDEEILQSFLQMYEFKDIEYVLQAIKDIKNFSESNGGKYLKKMQENNKLTFNLLNNRFSEFSKKINSIEKVLVKKIFDEYHWKKNDSEILQDVHYEIMNYLTRLGTLAVFTTNYDNAIEELCEEHYEEFRLIDGFVRNPSDRNFSIWEGDFSDKENRNPARNNIRYYKLHGSLNWKHHVIHGIVKTNEESISLDSKFTENVLIFPTLSPKLEEKAEPFKTLISEFRKRLFELDSCIVIGFSFRDSMSQIFKDFLMDKGSLVIVSPSGYEDFMKNVAHIEKPKQIKKKVICVERLFDSEVDLHFIQTEVSPRNGFTIVKQLMKVYGKIYND